MSQIDDYSIIETKKMIVKYMIEAYEISEQEALNNLKDTIIIVSGKIERIKKDVSGAIIQRNTYYIIYGYLCRIGNIFFEYKI